MAAAGVGREDIDFEPVEAAGKLAVDTAVVDTAVAGTLVVDTAVSAEVGTGIGVADTEAVLVVGEGKLGRRNPVEFHQFGVSRARRRRDE